MVLSPQQRQSAEAAQAAFQSRMQNAQKVDAALSKIESKWMSISGIKGKGDALGLGSLKDMKLASQKAMELQKLYDLVSKHRSSLIDNPLLMQRASGMLQSRMTSADVVGKNAQKLLDDEEKKLNDIIDKEMLRKKNLETVVRSEQQVLSLLEKIKALENKPMSSSSRHELANQRRAAARFAECFAASQRKQCSLVVKGFLLQLVRFKLPHPVW